MNPLQHFTFKILDIEAATEFEKQVTVPGPTGPLENPNRFIGVSSWVILDNTTPTFNWNEVTGATYYRVRIYGWNGNTIYRGYVKAPPYTLPPGILKPDGIYKYRIAAIKSISGWNGKMPAAAIKIGRCLLRGPMKPRIHISIYGATVFTPGSTIHFGRLHPFLRQD